MPCIPIPGRDFNAIIPMGAEGLPADLKEFTRKIRELKIKNPKKPYKKIFNYIKKNENLLSLLYQDRHLVDIKNRFFVKIDVL